MDRCSGRQGDACGHYFLAPQPVKAHPPERQLQGRQSPQNTASPIKEACREVTNADLWSRGRHGEARGRDEQSKKRMIVLRMNKSEG